MAQYLVMSPAPHAGNTAAWDMVHSNTPHSVQRTAAVPTCTHGAGDTVLIVPAAALSWHRVTLHPGLLRREGQAKQEAKLKTVLEGLLEDQLLDEPPALHLALQATSNATGPWWVAACQRAWLGEQVRLLREAGHTVRGIVPEWAPAPADAPPTLWLTGDEESACWVWTDETGVHQRSAEWAASVLAQPALAAAPLYAEAGCAQRAEHLTHREVTVQHRADRLRSAAQAPWSLSQGEFASRNPWLQRSVESLQGLWQAPAWRPARWALGVLAVVQLAGLNAQAWQARQALAEQRQAIQSVLTTTFPSTTVVVDAPLQMQRAVEALGQASGQTKARDLERLLESFGHVAGAESTPSAMEYIAGELRVTPPGGMQEPTAALRDGLQARGVRIRTEGTVWVLSP
jgi:general secretion pathway protein L